MKLTSKADLTRWNRTGLSEFRYIDGNTITYLETLRQQLVENYEKDGSPIWTELVERFPELPHETPSRTHKRLNDQYYDDRRDYAWEILRTFSRSTHILGEYINAYANEAYLPTAVEWDHVRKLVAMLGYQPSPPASAETYIALLFKENESGEVEKGFAVKNKPGKGEATVIFETQEKLEGDAEINRLHLKDWNRNLTTFQPAADDTIRFYLEDNSGDINVGDIGVLATVNNGNPVKVIDIGNDVMGNYLILEAESISGFSISDTTLYLQPGFVSSPLPNGQDSVTLDKKAGFNESEIVFGNNSTGWHARRVIKNELGHLQFEEGGDALENEERLFRSRVLKRQNHPELGDGSELYLLPDDFSSNQRFFTDDVLEELLVTINTLHIDDDTGQWESMIAAPDSLTSSAEQVLIRYIVAQESWGDIYFPDRSEIGEINQAGQSALRFSGKSSDLESGGWALTHQGSTVIAHLINGIKEDEEWFTVNLQGMTTNEVSLLRSAFKLNLKARNHNVNTNAAWSDTSSDTVTILELDDLASVQELKLGQKLICASDDLSFSVELKEIKTNSDISQLHVFPPFHLDSRSSAFTRNNTVLYGNAVRATHGETQPEKIIGNGDASQTQQSFDLPSDTISWIADASFTTGVRADLILRVGQRLWQQVEDLSLSGPEAHHYDVKVNENGMLSVCFGDGRHGRRLPSGIDNVRVRYRTGYGEQGNLPANALVKIARKHRLIEDFAAPLETTGGAEKEASESMRESAPATVLALGRAVSLHDFAHLAAHHSMVWQARAFEKMPDRPARSQIEVVVVAAGGAPFVTGSDTATLIQNFLSEHAAPGTPVAVVSYEPLLMQLRLSIMVDETAYDKKQVQAAVIEHLKSRLDIKDRKLGQPLFRSEIITLLEQVEGVENGHCDILSEPYASLGDDSKPRLHIGANGKVRKVSISPRQLIFLDTETYPLEVIPLAYEI